MLEMKNATTTTKILSVFGSSVDWTQLQETISELWKEMDKSFPD